MTYISRAFAFHITNFNKILSILLNHYNKLTMKVFLQDLDRKILCM